MFYVGFFLSKLLRLTKCKVWFHDFFHLTSFPWSFKMCTFHNDSQTTRAFIFIPFLKSRFNDFMESASNSDLRKGFIKGKKCLPQSPHTPNDLTVGLTSTLSRSTNKPWSSNALGQDYCDWQVVTATGFLCIPNIVTSYKRLKTGKPQFLRR